MFSTSFHDSLRYIVVCLTIHHTIKAVETIIDTGAIYTCYMAHSIDPEMTESDVSDHIHKDFGGFVDGKNRVVRFYQYPLKQFTIGNIDMGAQNVWITFDKRISDNVLGMDILQSIDFLQFRDTGRISFFQNKAELAEYVANIQRESEATASPGRGER